MSGDVSEFEALDQVTALERKLSEAQSSAREAAATARAKDRELAELREERDQLETALDISTAVQKSEQPGWLTPKEDPDKRRGTLVACWSDYHYGEVVEPSEMNWYNAYNPDIAEQRIRRFFERTIRVARDFLAGVEYDGIVVPSLGDGISGDIHDEFRETNELSNYEAVPKLVPLLENGFDMLLDEFGKVHVVSVPGNHPRDSKRPRYKKRSQHNADTMIFKFLEQKFAGDDRITFDIPNAYSADFTVYSTKFRAEHGDEASGGGGIQGAMLPLALRTHRVRKQAEAEGVPFDVLLMGHWHQYMSLVSKGFLVNGSGKGYDEYARGKGFEPEPPQQALMVVTPEHGIGVQAPLFVGKRSEEGW